VFAALLGVLLTRSSVERYFLSGLWIGYVIFGLAFTYHIHNHLYYQLMLIPVVALSIGVTASYILGELAFNRGIWRLGVWVLFVISIALSVKNSVTILDDAGFKAQVEAYEEIGEKVNHSPNTVIFDPHEGDRVMYYGRIFGLIWPIKNQMEFSGDSGFEEISGKELLQKIIKEHNPEYFIITTVHQFEEQEDLKRALVSEFPVLAESRTSGNVNSEQKSDSVRYVIPQVPGGESPDYIIYDLTKHKAPADVPRKPE
jgi:hypothetical protein